MNKIPPSIAYSELTESWYWVSKWKAENVAATKVDITDQMNQILTNALKDAEPLMARKLEKAEARIEELMSALRSHHNEVYNGETEGQWRPNFIWDIELYQEAGILPQDYDIPKEDELEGTNFQLRKLLVESNSILEEIMNYAHTAFPDRTRNHLHACEQFLVAKTNPTTELAAMLKEVTDRLDHRLNYMQSVETDTKDTALVEKVRQALKKEDE